MIYPYVNNCHTDRFDYFEDPLKHKQETTLQQSLTSYFTCSITRNHNNNISTS